MAKIFKVDKKELLILWLAGQIYDVIKDEDAAFNSMNVALEELKTQTKRTKKKQLHEFKYAILTTCNQLSLDSCR